MKLYRLLLHLYPSSYRADYGDEMCADFEQELRLSNGVLSKLWLWLAAIVDVVSSAAAVQWEIARRDVSYSLRSLKRSPGFTVTALLLITIGIGANAAIFTLADFVLIRPLPFPHSERLVEIWEKHKGYSHMELSPANYRDFKTPSTSFEGMGAYTNLNSKNLVGQGEPVRIDGAQVTGNLFEVLQKPALIGRSFTEHDDTPGAPGTVVLSYSLWQNEFSGDAGVLGKTIFLDGEPYAVVGVMPADFHFPDRETQFWTTFRFDEDAYKERDNNYIVGIGRLKPGCLDGAGAHRDEPDCCAIAAAISEGERERRGQRRVFAGRAVDAIAPAAAHVVWRRAVHAGNHVREPGKSSTGTLAGAAEGAFDPNIAGCEPAIHRAATARREHDPWNCRRRCCRGPGLRRVCRCCHGWYPNALPVAQVPPLDVRMLLFALGLTALTVVAFGIAPAIRASRSAGLSGLREGVRTGGTGHHRVRSALVIAEVVTSVVLLTSSGLLIRALWKVQSTDPGFRTDGILTMRTELPSPKYEKVTRSRAVLQPGAGRYSQLAGRDRGRLHQRAPHENDGRNLASHRGRPLGTESFRGNFRKPAVYYARLLLDPWAFPLSKVAPSVMAIRQTGNGLPW